MEVIHMEVKLEGRKVNTIADFHQQISDSLDLGPYYGMNFNALWDCLTTDVERPIKLIWIDSEYSRAKLGDQSFKMITKIFQDVKKEDEKLSLTEKFEFELC
jgi:ribonuclease inhibitor